MSGLAFAATLVALILSLLAASYLIVAPTYKSVESSVSTDAVSTMTETRSTLIQQNGWSAVVPVTIPVLICFAALLQRRKRPARSIAAIIMAAFVVLTGFSIGLLYAPSAAAMVVAALAKS